MSKEQVDRVYSAQTTDEQQIAYDGWAEEYERDLFRMGYRSPIFVATCFIAHVSSDVTPILDAGCGAGAQAEPLPTLGYQDIVGIDLSEGMMAVAAAKNIYAELKQQVLGETLDFPDDHFGAVLSSGTITPGHAPAHSFDELIRVVRPGGRIVFSLRCDQGLGPDYPQHIAALEASGAWKHIVSTAPHQPMPYGHPEVWGKIHVYEVL